MLKILNWLFCVILSPFPIEWIFCCREFLYHINIHFYELFLNEIKSFILNFFSSFSLSLTLDECRHWRLERERARVTLDVHQSGIIINWERKRKISIVKKKILSSHGEKKFSLFFRVNQQTSFTLAIDDHLLKTMQNSLKFSFHLMRLSFFFYSFSPSINPDSMRWKIIWNFLLLFAASGS